MTALREALAALDGGRLDAVTVTPETGLVMLSVWTAEGLRRLVAGVGPRVAGVGFSVREAARAKSSLNFSGSREVVIFRTNSILSETV